MTGPAIQSLLDARACACGACREVRTAEIAVTSSPESAIARRAGSRAVALVCDRNTLGACADALAGKLRARDGRVFAKQERTRRTIEVAPEARQDLVLTLHVVRTRRQLLVSVTLASTTVFDQPLALWIVMFLVFVIVVVSV